MLQTFSCQLGPLVAQNGKGDMVKEVRDRGLSYGENKSSRYSDTRFGGNYHTDGAEVPTPIRYFPFYCLSPAAKGGITRVVSAYSVHNRLLAEDPDNLDVKYDPSYTGPAQEAFETRKVNCLSYTHLFVGMARELGVEAYFLSVRELERYAKDGDLILACDTHRSQRRNRDEVTRRLAEMVREALVPPRPRRKTRPTTASKKRRLEDKKRRSRVKKDRRKPDGGD